MLPNQQCQSIEGSSMWLIIQLSVARGQIRQWLKWLSCTVSPIKVQGTLFTHVLLRVAITVLYYVVYVCRNVILLTFVYSGPAVKFLLYWKWFCIVLICCCVLTCLLCRLTVENSHSHKMSIWSLKLSDTERWYLVIILVNFLFSLLSVAFDKYV